MNKVYDAYMRYMESKGFDKTSAFELLLFAEANNLIENEERDVQDLWKKAILHLEQNVKEKNNVAN